MNSLQTRLSTGLITTLAALTVLAVVMGGYSLRRMAENFVAARLEHDLETVLAAGSIGFNIYQGQGGADAPAGAAGGEGSIEQLRAAAEASSSDAGPWGDLAFAYFNQGKYEEAAAAYRRATQIAPGEAVLWSALGESLVLASKRQLAQR